MASKQAESCMHLWYAEERKLTALTVKCPKCNLWRILDINWIPITGKPTKCSGIAGIKSALQRLMNYLSLEAQRQCMLHVSCNTLQQVKQFKYLEWHSRVTEDWTKRSIHALVKKTQLCVRFVVLWWQNWSFQTQQGCHFLNQSWVMIKRILSNPSASGRAALCKEITTWNFATIFADVQI